jgi:hypothetical protein
MVFIPERALDSIFNDASERKVIAYAQDQLWNNVYSRPHDAQPLRRSKPSRSPDDI